jgi:hypothetical protein
MILQLQNLQYSIFLLLPALHALRVFSDMKAGMTLPALKLPRRKAGSWVFEPASNKN